MSNVFEHQDEQDEQTKMSTPFPVLLVVVVVCGVAAHAACRASFRCADARLLCAPACAARACAAACRAYLHHAARPDLPSPACPHYSQDGQWMHARFPDAAHVRRARVSRAACLPFLPPAGRCRLGKKCSLFLVDEESMFLYLFLYHLPCCCC